MGTTKLTIEGRKFRVNGKLTYEEIPESKEKMRGLLMNARFIQGLFESDNPVFQSRYGKNFDPDTNTSEMIEALPQWYAKGLRCITVGMQGGGSCFTVKGEEMENNPFSFDGLEIDLNYLNRLDRIITACDKLGMVVIVSYFYGANTRNLDGAQAILNIVRKMSRILKDKAYTNVMIEVANEYNLSCFNHLPIIKEPQGMVALIDLARECSGGMLVGCSPYGGTLDEEVCKASDVVFLHGNGQSRGKLYNLICRAQEFAGEKPIVINEDSQALGQLTVCEELATSWGYYNNMTKQEPPCDWGITEGEDRFFAYRMAEMIGIRQEPIPESEWYYFQGLEPHMHYQNQRFPRVASLYPEKINFVRFFQNDKLIYVAYDESFLVNYVENWWQKSVLTETGDIWKAELHLRCGEVKVLEQRIENL
ncbi:MAG: hypothetical protein R3Y63_07200 [Eubacteriales bacterium]